MTEPLTHEDRKPEITQRGLCRGERGAGPQSRRCPCVGLSRLWAQQRQRGLHRSLRSSQHALGGVRLGGGHDRRKFSVGTNQRTNATQKSRKWQLEGTVILHQHLEERDKEGLGGEWKLEAGKVELSLEEGI